jgi:hypothetical protein
MISLIVILTNAAIRLFIILNFYQNHSVQDLLPLCCFKCMVVDQHHVSSGSTFLLMHIHIEYTLETVSKSFIYLLLDELQILNCVVICRQYRNLAAKKKFTPWPIEMRFCEDSASQHKPRYLHHLFP